MSDNGEEFSASGDEFAMPELVSSDPKEEEVKTEASHLIRPAHDLSVPFAAIDRLAKLIGEGDKMDAILHEESVAAVKRADETSKMAQQPHRFESDGFEAVKKTASETSYAQSRGVELADAIIRQADEAMKRSSETRNEAKTAPRLSERQAATNALYDEVIRLQKVENTLKAALQSAPQKAAATAFIEREYAELKDLVYAGKLSLDQFKVLWEAALLVERRMDPPK